jgi:hypothetical protein
MKTARQLERLDAALRATPAHVLLRLDATAAEWKALQERMEGHLVFPGDPAYPADRRGNSLYPDLASPDVIAYCEVESDVAWCLQLVRANGPA